MPGLYKDEGVVLKTIKLGEADRILTIFTRSNGKVRAVAKGVRKTKSRFGGRLEPFTRVDLMVYRGRKDLDTVTGADIIEAFHPLRADYERLAAAAALCELVEKITPDREEAFPLYALLVSGLRAVSDAKGPTVVPAFLIKTLSLSGFDPALDSCAGCGATTLLGGFSPSLGGAVCATCWREDQEAIGIPSAGIELMAALLAGEFGLPGEPAVVEEVTQALRSYAEYHLERPLRSLQMLRAV